MQLYFGMRICAYEPGTKSMCSPGGNATLNSLMNDDTLEFEITVHSHSLTPNTASGTFIERFPFTLA